MPRWPSGFMPKTRRCGICWAIFAGRRGPPVCASCCCGLSPEALEEALRKWVLAILGETEGAELLITPLDGKSLGGTLEAHGRAIHLLSMLDQNTGCVLKQWAVPSETNEAKAALPVLRTLVLEGRVVTGDAMFCQKDVCQTILDSGGDYFVVV